MDFMGIGPLELLVIMIVGFLAFGPDRLPKMAAAAGRLWSRFKKATFDLATTMAEETETNKGKEEKSTPQLAPDEKDK